MVGLLFEICIVDASIFTARLDTGLVVVLVGRELVLVGGVW